MFVGVICGKCLLEGWVNGCDGVDFFDVKVDVEVVLVSVGVFGDFSFVFGEYLVLYLGQIVCIEWEGWLVGYLGVLYLELVKKFDFEQLVFFFELLLVEVVDGYLLKFCELLCFFEVCCDLVLLVDQDVLV